MKNKYLFQLLFLCFTVSALAQNGKVRREKMDQIKSMKIAYITNELSLTADEATKFWPIYDSFEAKQQNIRKQKLRGNLDLIDNVNIDKLSDKEALKILLQIENAEEDLYQNKKKLHANLQSIISPIKILKLQRAEQNFNKKILKQLQNRKREK